VISERSAVPRLHLVTDDDVLARADWMGTATEVIEAGGTSVALHVRGPRTTGRTLFDLTSALVGDASRCGAWLVVSDRADVALAAGADAVHLGQRSLSIARTRKRVLPRGKVGASCRSASDVSRANADGADYAFAGTVFPTPSHPGDSGIGVSGFRDIVANEADFPVLAIGGVGVDQTAALVAAGAHGVAVVRGVWDASYPAAAVVEYLEALAGVERREDRGGA
jgi:thiamine-phosphate pyrophosphorylase